MLRRRLRRRRIHPPLEKRKEQSLLTTGDGDDATDPSDRPTDRLSEGACARLCVCPCVSVCEYDINGENGGKKRDEDEPTEEGAQEALTSRGARENARAAQAARSRSGSSDLLLTRTSPLAPPSTPPPLVLSNSITLYDDDGDDAVDQQVRSCVGWNDMDFNAGEEENAEPGAARTTAQHTYARVLVADVAAPADGSQLRRNRLLDTANSRSGIYMAHKHRLLPNSSAAKSALGLISRLSSLFGS